MRPPRRANHRELVSVRPIPAEPQHRPRRCPQRDARRASGVSARRRERTRRRCGTRSRDAQAHSEREKQPWPDGSHPPEITTPTGKHVPVPQRCLTKRRSVPMRESSALEACVSGTRCSGSTSSRAPALKPPCCRSCHIRRPCMGRRESGPGLCRRAARPVVRRGMRRCQMRCARRGRWRTDLDASDPASWLDATSDEDHVAVAGESPPAETWIALSTARWRSRTSLHRRDSPRRAGDGRTSARPMKKQVSPRVVGARHMATRSPGW